MTKEQDEFVEVMMAEGVTRDTAWWVISATDELHQLAEDACNVGLRPDQVAREDQLESEIRGWLTPFVDEIHFQGDPRGAVVKLRLKSGKSNDWGGEGLFCVP